MNSCFSCGKDTGIIEKPGRRDTCPSCGSDLRVCLNCRFYDMAAYNECREPAAERVVEKDKANFCDYFSFESGASGKDADMDMDKDEAKKKLDDLFR